MEVQGFDYITGKNVAMLPAAWRKRYPAPKYRRAAGEGETAYYSTEFARGRVAEAYAIIPAGTVP